MNNNTKGKFYASVLPVSIGLPKKINIFDKTSTQESLL